MNQEIEVIKSNPEQAKASIYKNQAIAAFANAYSWETNKINLLENPILKAEQWERNFQFDREKHNWTKFKDQHSMAMAEKEYALKYEKQMAELYGISGEFEAYGGLSTKVDDPVVALQNDINTKDQRAGSILNELSTIKINGSKANKEYWAKQIAEYEKTQDLSLIPATARPLVEEYIKTKKEATNLKAGVKKAEEEALNDPEVKRDQEKVKAELSQVPPRIPATVCPYVINKDIAIPSYLALDTLPSSLPTVMLLTTGKYCVVLSNKSFFTFSSYFSLA